MTEYVCTRWYRAPEIMVSRQRYDCKVDVWSVGCIWAELLLGKPLFQTGNHFELLSMMFQILGTPSFISDDKDNCDAYWVTDKDALNWMKTLKYQGGCDLRKLFNNTVPEAVDVLSTMLELNPHKRCSVNNALSSPYFHRYEQYFRQNKKCKKFQSITHNERAMNTLFGARSYVTLSCLYSVVLYRTNYRFILFIYICIYVFMYIYVYLGTMYDALVQFKPKENENEKIKRPATPNQRYSFLVSPKS